MGGGQPRSRALSGDAGGHPRRPRVQPDHVARRGPRGAQPDPGAGTDAGDAAAVELQPQLPGDRAQGRGALRALRPDLHQRPVAQAGRLGVEEGCSTSRSPTTRHARSRSLSSHHSRGSRYRRGAGDRRGPGHDARLADDISAFIGAVGLDAAVLLGASSGGYVAQRFGDRGARLPSAPGGLQGVEREQSNAAVDALEAATALRFHARSGVWSWIDSVARTVPGLATSVTRLARLTGRPNQSPPRGVASPRARPTGRPESPLPRRGCAGPRKCPSGRAATRPAIRTSRRHRSSSRSAPLWRPPPPTAGRADPLCVRRPPALAARPPGCSSPGRRTRLPPHGRPPAGRLPARPPR